MTVKIIPATPNSFGKVADAEVALDGALTGFTLTGFTIWQKRTGSGHNVTFPDRKYKDKSGVDKRYEFLRTANPELADRLKTKILSAFYETTREDGVEGL